MLTVIQIYLKITRFYTVSKYRLQLSCLHASAENHATAQDDHRYLTLIHSVVRDIIGFVFTLHPDNYNFILVLSKS